MTFEIKEQNEKMVVNVNGRLDTPAGCQGTAGNRSPA